MLLYWFLSPVPVITRPVHFDYGAVYKRLPPTAVIDLRAQHEDWKATNSLSECVIDTPLPKKPARTPLRQKKKYDIRLRLDLPRSPANEKCGMFMVNAILLDGERVKLGSSKRPAILPYASNLVHGIRVFASFPFFIWGSRKEVDHVDIGLFNNYVEITDHRLQSIELHISRPCVQVAGARITIEPHLYRTQWLMKHYFFTSALGGIFIINSLFGVLVLLLILWVYTHKPNKDDGRQQQSSNSTHPVEDDVSTQLHPLSENEARLSVSEMVSQVQDEMQPLDDSSSYSAMLAEVESHQE